MSTLTETSRIVLIFILTNIIVPHRSDNDVAINDVDIKNVMQDEHRLYNDDINYTSELDTANTTEAYNTTDVPEAIIGGPKTKETDEEYDEVKVGTETADVTEGNDHTVSNQDNSVDRADDDVYNISNTNYYDGRVETTSVLTTTRQTEDEDSIFERTPELEDDQGSSEQRGSNFEISDQGDIDPDQRNYEPSNLPPTSKSSTLRGWLEDSWLRPPAAVLVPLRPMALNRALAVWKDVTVENLNVSDIVIVGYDSNGINWRSRNTIQPLNSSPKDVTEALSKLLLKYQGVHIDEASDGTMRALASAAKLVPYDSALFVVTDKGAGDPQRLPLALRTLVEKRLKVYTIWTDPNHPSMESENALQELRNISQHTEGDVLHYSLQVIDMEGASNFASDADLQPWKPIELKQGRKGRVNPDVDIERFDTLLVRRGGGEAISLGLPVENGVTALRILIEGSVEHAVLYPPNDAPQIDLYNVTSVSTFSPASRTDSLSPRDVYLVFPGAEPIEDMLTVVPVHPNQDYNPGLAGVWHFSVRCDTCDYRICVTGRGHIHFDVETYRANTLKLRVTGPVASIRESLLIDEYGTELSKLAFSYQPMTNNGDAESIELTDELEAEVNLPSMRGSKVYVKIVGRDLRGEPFVRLAGPLNKAEVRLGRSATITFPDAVDDLERVEDENSRAYSRLRYNNGNDSVLRTSSQVVSQQGTVLTEVQIGLSTRLYGSPGDELQLYFEVTNYRDQSVRFSFGAVGELRFLTGINPTSQVLSPGQTANVIVRATISSTAQPGARDFITFTAYGLEQVSISAYVYVVASGVTVSDVWAPELSHNFQGTCIGRMGSDCAQYSWSATIIARDANGGLLRLSSSPSGLAYDSNFIAGTRDEVTAIYRANCCAPRMLVNAVDAFGNTNSYIVDISYYITGAGIAAIVLGVILAIALIAVLVSLIYCCVKRRRESRELPYSTSSRNIS